MSLPQVSVKDTVNKEGIKTIFRSSLLTRYFFIVLLAWFSLNVSFYSLYLGMGNFGLSIFLIQLMYGAIEIPAILLNMWLLEVFGRRLLFIFTTLSGGLCSIVILAVSQGYPIALTALAVGARFFLIWSCSICGIFVQELFPTSVRQTATAFGNMSARAGGLVAPLLSILATYHWAIPTTVFSSLTLVSGVLGFLLPETRRKELPESADQAEGNRNVTSARKESVPYLTSTEL